MQIGLIGAGKVGFSLGRYFKEKGLGIKGFYSQNPESASSAADFTGTKAYGTLSDLVRDCEALFLTVPDDNISSVWNSLRKLQIRGKCIIHCSGCLSSAIFSEINRTHAYGYSIHPLFAIRDKYQGWEGLSEALFTVEGHEKYLSELVCMLKECGNPVQVIEKENKVKYHAAAVFSSNLMVGLAGAGFRVLQECGFDEENARIALSPLMRGNMANILELGLEAALTGPVERGDLGTVSGHLKELSNREREIYRLLSLEVLEIAEKKHESRDYTAIKESLRI